MKKKITAVILALSVLLWLPISSSAEESTAKFSFEMYDFSGGVKGEQKYKIKKDECFLLDINLDVSPIYLSQIALRYDNNYLEPGYFDDGVWKASQAEYNGDNDVGTENCFYKICPGYKYGESSLNLHSGSVFESGAARVQITKSIILHAFFVSGSSAKPLNESICTIMFMAKQDINNIYGIFAFNDSSTFVMPNENDEDTIQSEVLECVHFYEESVVTSPSCLSGGLKQQKCRICDDVKNIPLNALNHDFSDNAEYCRNNCGTENPDYVPPAPDPEPTTIQEQTATQESTTNPSSVPPTAVTPAKPKITVKPTAVKSLKGNINGFTVKWKKLGGVSGYQLQYSLKKNMKKSKKKTVKTQKKNSLKIRRLKSKKKYYVRVRAYKTVNGKKHYSKWSKIKAVKTK